MKNIKGFPRYAVRKDGTIINKKTGCVMKGKTTKEGYKEVSLQSDEGQKSLLVHRLIAEAFCKRSAGTTEVNHINGVKSDNRAENLEWVTHGENLRHAFENGLMSNNATPREVIAQDMQTGAEQKFPSIYRAARLLKTSQGNICMACQGKRPHAGGYFWRYA